MITTRETLEAVGRGAFFAGVDKVTAALLVLNGWDSGNRDAAADPDKFAFQGDDGSQWWMQYLALALTNAPDELARAGADAYNKLRRENDNLRDEVDRLQLILETNNAMFRDAF